MFDLIDVICDGNCGFRAIAVTELGGEEAWPLLRRAIRAEQSLVKTVNQTRILVFGLVYCLNGLVWFFFKLNYGLRYGLGLLIFQTRSDRKPYYVKNHNFVLKKLSCYLNILRCSYFYIAIYT